MTNYEGWAGLIGLALARHPEAEYKEKFGSLRFTHDDAYLNPYLGSIQRLSPYICIKCGALASLTTVDHHIASRCMHCQGLSDSKIMVSITERDVDTLSLMTAKHDFERDEKGVIRLSSPIAGSRPTGTGLSPILMLPLIRDETFTLNLLNPELVEPDMNKFMRRYQEQELHLHFDIGETVEILRAYYDTRTSPHYENFMYQQISMNATERALNMLSSLQEKMSLDVIPTAPARVIKL